MYCERAINLAQREHTPLQRGVQGPSFASEVSYEAFKCKFSVCQIYNKGGFG
jgi:hypothetical protein